MGISFLPIEHDTQIEVDNVSNFYKNGTDLIIEFNNGEVLKLSYRKTPQLLDTDISILESLIEYKEKYYAI